MKIGITCYPTYGGSGVVATELGMELAARGHEIHFISYAPPIRLTDTNDRIQFHEVEISSYPLFDHAPYALSLAVKMMEVAESENSGPAACPLCDSPFRERIAGPRRWRRPGGCPSSPPFTERTLRWSEMIEASCRSRKFSIEQSDGVTAISHYLKQRTLEEFDIKRPIEVIPNFVNCDLYCRKENPAMRAEWAPDGEPILMHLSNFRPVKRITDVVEIFALVREKMRAKLVLIGDGPDRAAAEYLVRKRKLARDVHFLGKQDRVYQHLGAGGLVPPAFGHGIVWPGGARSHGV